MTEARLSSDLAAMVRAYADRVEAIHAAPQAAGPMKLRDQDPDEIRVVADTIAAGGDDGPLMQSMQIEFTFEVPGPAGFPVAIVRVGSHVESAAADRFEAALDEYPNLSARDVVTKRELLNREEA
jgi:hypothetical protein